MAFATDRTVFVGGIFGAVALLALELADGFQFAECFSFDRLWFLV